MADLSYIDFAPQLRAERMLPGLCMLRFAFPPGFEVPRHAHEKPVLVVQLAGGYAGTLRREEYETRLNDVIVVPPVAKHAERIGQQGAEAILIELERRDLRSGFGERFERFRGFALEPLIKKLSRESMARDTAAPVALESAILELGATLRRLPPLGAGDVRSRWLEQVRERIDAEYTEPLQLSRLAAEAGVSRSYLARAFRKKHGCSAGDYLRNRRLEHAARLLVTTELPLIEVALSCGFYDQSHFCRSFRQHKGTTPSAWRARRSGCSD